MPVVAERRVEAGSFETITITISTVYCFRILYRTIYAEFIYNSLKFTIELTHLHEFYGVLCF